MLTVVGVFGLSGYFVFARLGIIIVFGEDFLASVPVLRILSFAIPFMFLNSLFGSFLNATGKELIFTKITGVTALLNVLLNYILILNYGAEGAAIATLCTQGLALILSALSVKNTFKQTTFK